MFKYQCRKRLVLRLQWLYSLPSSAYRVLTQELELHVELELELEVVSALSLLHRAPPSTRQTGWMSGVCDGLEPRCPASAWRREHSTSDTMVRYSERSRSGDVVWVCFGASWTSGSSSPSSSQKPAAAACGCSRSSSRTQEPCFRTLLEFNSFKEQWASIEELLLPHTHTHTHSHYIRPSDDTRGSSSMRKYTLGFNGWPTSSASRDRRVSDSSRDFALTGSHPVFLAGQRNIHVLLHRVAHVCYRSHVTCAVAAAHRAFYVSRGQRRVASFTFF